MNNLYKDRRVPVVPVILVLLSGCGTTGGVNVLSPTTFSVSAQNGRLFGGWDKAQEEALSQGKQYCAAKGETFALISERRSGVTGFTP